MDRELESFREQWRQEVNERTKSQKANTPAEANSSSSHTRNKSGATLPLPHSVTSAKNKANDDDEGVYVRSFHDLEEREHGHRLGDAASSAQQKKKEPSSALEFYEAAVEQETNGRLGDSVSLYRRAFRLDPNVDRAYKNKHFPPSFFAASKSTPKPADLNPSNAPSTVPGTAHASLTGYSASLSGLLSEFSQNLILGEAPPTSLSPAPPCPISTIPEELLVEILLQIGIDDVAALVRVAGVCKRLAYVILTEERIWKRISLGPESGFAAMHYEWNCQMNGSALGDDGEGGRLVSSMAALNLTDADDLSPIYKFAHPVQTSTSLVPNPYKSHLSMFRTRPRLRFAGVYISTVNYTRAGGTSATQATWNSAVHIVTYYRYLRFFRDGTVITLLTTAEPADVVQHMIMENVKVQHSSGLPQAVMKDALKGRWRLSGPADTAHEQYLPGSSSLEAGEMERIASGTEEEGTLHIETEGVIPKYLYCMTLSVGSAGRGAKSNRLSWNGYWNFNKLTDDWAEFGLRNYRPFYWSRVKRFTGA